MRFYREEGIEMIEYSLEGVLVSREVLVLGQHWDSILQSRCEVSMENGLPRPSATAFCQEIILGTDLKVEDAAHCIMQYVRSQTHPLREL